MKHHSDIQMDEYRCPECMHIMYLVGRMKIRNIKKKCHDVYFHHYIGNQEHIVTVLKCIWCGKSEIVGGFCPRNEEGEFLHNVGR